MARRAVAAAGDTAAPLDLAKAWTGIGTIAGEQGDLEAAQTAFEQALELARALGDETRLAVALGNLGTLALLLEDYATTRRLCEEAVAICRRRGDDARLSIQLENLAGAALSEGALERALELAREGVAAAVRSDDPRTHASTGRVLGVALLRLGQTEAVGPELLRSFDLALGVGDRHSIIQTTEVAAALATSRGDPETAAVLLGAADAARVEIGAPRPRDELRWLGPFEDEMAARLGPAALESARARGRLLRFEDAVELARASACHLASGAPG